MRAAESFNQNRNIAQLAKNSKIGKAPSYFSNDFPPFGRFEYVHRPKVQSHARSRGLFFKPSGFEFLHSPWRAFGENMETVL